MPFFMRLNLFYFDCENQFDFELSELEIMETQTIGQQMKELRKSMGLTQSEMAFKCHLDIRTIQRIESGTVHPRAYTLNSINDSLGSDLPIDCNERELEQECQVLKQKFMRRKKLRMGLLIFAVVFMILVGLILLFSPSQGLFGIPKRQWTPFVYVIMFAYLIVIGQVWRCPGCNGLLGDIFNTRYCSKCGLNLAD